jgi:hypothetical protein
METLDVRVLRGLAGLEVHQLDLPFDRRGQKMTPGQFWSVVAANRLWLATLRDDLVQHARHARTGKSWCLPPARGHSRVYASTTLSTRIALPAATASYAKSKPIPGWRLRTGVTEHSAGRSASASSAVE